MSARDLFKLELPTEEQPEPDNVVQLREVEGAGTVSAPAVEDRPALKDRLRPAVERFAAGWSAAWVGDGVLGMRPRPVSDLARQFWTAPPAYIRDALILRIPYALYGVPVIAVTVVAHLVLFVISYLALLTGACLLVLFISLFI